MNNTLYSHPDLLPIMENPISSTLGKVIQKAKWLLALDAVVQTLLPEQFAPYCKVMNVKQDILVLGISSAAVAMRVRMLSTDLVFELQKAIDDHSIREIQYKVYFKQPNQ